MYACNKKKKKKTPDYTMTRTCVFCVPSVLRARRSRVLQRRNTITVSSSSSSDVPSTPDEKRFGRRRVEGENRARAGRVFQYSYLIDLLSFCTVRVNARIIIIIISAVAVGDESRRRRVRICTRRSGVKTWRFFFLF